MKRAVRVLLLCAALAPVTTVAVAWWHATSVEMNWSSWRRARSHMDVPLWEYYAWERAGAMRILATAMFELPEATIRIDSPATKGLAEYPWSGIHMRPDPHEVTLREDARGWPLLALRSWWHGRPNESGRMASLSNVQWGIELPARSGDRRALPLRPIWTGFLADSLIFFIGWLGVILLPIAMIRGLRRFRNRARRRSGHCRDCGYDLRHADHQVCPECGAKLPASIPVIRHESQRATARCDGSASSSAGTPR